MPANHELTVELVNKRLLQDYGRFSTTDKPMWRVIWSEDQMEKRWVTHTKDGFAYLEPEVQLVPKYRQYIQDKYVLERIVALPEFIENDLVEQVSYEPVWVFEDKHGNALPPIWPAVRLVVEQVYKAAAVQVGRKYVDPDEAKSKMTKEERLAEVDKRVKELFGNETATGDSLAYKEGVTVPAMPAKETE